MRISEPALNEIETVQRKVVSILINEALGENYYIPFQFQILDLLKNMQHIEAQAFIYTWLKTREASELAKIAFVWEVMNRRAYLRMKAYMLYAVIRHDIEFFFSGINLNPLH